MKNLTDKIFKKKTNKVYSFNRLNGQNSTSPPSGDPTNTVVITIITTASGQPLFQNSDNPGDLRI